MNSWVLVYLGGNVGSDLLIVGAYATEQAAQAALITSGSPWNYQVCQVWGPPTPPPPPPSVQTPYSPAEVSPGAWLAIAPGTTPTGGLRFYGYGTFASKADATAWATSQDTPSAFSFGSVQPTF